MLEVSHNYKWEAFNKAITCKLTKRMPSTQLQLQLCLVNQGPSLAWVSLQPVGTSKAARLSAQKAAPASRAEADSPSPNKPEVIRSRCSRALSERKEICPEPAGLMLVPPWSEH